jgi:hypothetical protein
MKRNTFEEFEIPYSTLEKFGLTHEMVEDLPMFVLDDISNGKPTPVLPIRIKDDDGNTIESKARFALLRGENGKVDVVFYPVLKYAPLEQFDANQQELLKDGKSVMADVTSPSGEIIKAFVQIDTETNQVMAVPTAVIGRNMQVLSDELNLSSGEMKILQNGDALSFVSGEEMVTVGVDLRNKTGLRFAEGDAQKWQDQGKRDWDKFTFGCYGCWVMDDDGNLGYVSEDDYTDELWSEQKKSAERNAAVHQRK